GQEIGAHAARQVEHDVRAGLADAIDDLAEMRAVAVAFARLGIADVDMDDARARRGGLDTGVGDLLRRHRHRRMLLIIRRAAGHRAGQDRLVAHRHSSHSILPLTAMISPVIFLPASEVMNSTMSANSESSTLQRSDTYLR